MKTVDRGHSAEAAVGKYLKARGYEVLAVNWRTPRCEIDLIAQKDKTVYFCEVKYRADSAQGDGFAYLTPKKLQQMAFAAEVWVQLKGWSGDYSLLGAAVSGTNNEYVELVEI